LYSPPFLTPSRTCFTGVEERHFEASGPGTTPDQSPPRGEDEKAEGRSGGEGREEEEGEARQGVQARSRGREAAARHARVLGGGRGGGLGRRGPRSEGRRGRCGRDPPPFYLWDEDEGEPAAPEETRAVASAHPSFEGAERGSSPPAAGEETPAPGVPIRGDEAAAGEESSMLAAPSHQADTSGAPSG